VAEVYDHIVIGAGALGSAAAYWLARSGARNVLVLEQFELGHARGASEDHSRIIRLSYHTPGYVALARAAYECWAALEADAFGERAIDVWGVNYPGFGGSTGPARLKRMGEAGVAAFDALKTKADGKPIYVFGASIGSAVALHVAANRDVRGLVLHNPPPLRQIILRNYGWWNLWLLAGPVALQIPPDLDSVANAKRIHAPAIFLLAENDEIVPPRFQRLVVDSFAGEKQVIPLPGAYHNSPIEGPVVTEIHHAYDWLFGAARSP